MKILFLAFLLVCSCSSVKKVTTASLIQGTYYLSRIEGYDEIQNFNPIPFTFKENAIEVQLEVNRCQLQLKQTQNELEIGLPHVCTEACCDQPTTIQILQFVSNGRYKKEMTPGDSFVLQNSKNQKLYFSKSKPIAEPSLSWEGIRYQIKSYELNQKNFNYPEDVSVEILFENENIQLKLERNLCMGNYQKQGDLCVINQPLGCTKMCCDSKESLVMMQELSGKFKLKQEGKHIYIERTDNNLRLLLEAMVIKN